MTVLDNEELAAHAAEEQLRARIRNAATAKIGAQGFRTPMRAIAAAAELNLEVVRDLFASKRDLINACDDYIVATVRATKSQALQSHDPATWPLCYAITPATGSARPWSSTPTGCWPMRL